MKASEAAKELRRIADGLDKDPDLEIFPHLSIESMEGGKEGFLRLARIAPRPLEKKIRFEGTNYEKFSLENGFWNISIPRKDFCILVEEARPARYECPTIFSAEEEEAFGKF